MTRVSLSYSVFVRPLTDLPMNELNEQQVASHVVFLKHRRNASNLDARFSLIKGENLT